MKEKFERPTFDRPSFDKPQIDIPQINRPNIKKPVVEKPVVEKPVFEKPVVEKEEPYVIIRIKSVSDQNGKIIDYDFIKKYLIEKFKISKIEFVYNYENTEDNLIFGDTYKKATYYLPEIFKLYNEQGLYNIFNEIIQDHDELIEHLTVDPCPRIEKPTLIKNYYMFVIKKENLNFTEESRFKYPEELREVQNIKDHLKLSNPNPTEQINLTDFRICFDGNFSKYFIGSVFLETHLNSKFKENYELENSRSLKKAEEQIYLNKVNFFKKYKIILIGLFLLIVGITIFMITKKIKNHLKIKYHLN